MLIIQEYFTFFDINIQNSTRLQIKNDIVKIRRENVRKDSKFF